MTTALTFEPDTYALTPENPTVDIAVTITGVPEPDVHQVRTNVSWKGEGPVNGIIEGTWQADQQPPDLGAYLTTGVVGAAVEVVDGPTQDEDDPTTYHATLRVSVVQT